MQTSQAHSIDIKPVGDLGIIALSGCEELGSRINDYLVQWRRESSTDLESFPADPEYSKDTYLIQAATPRFGTGEAKGQIFESVRGFDIYLLVDVCNYSVTYQIQGTLNHKSPDDHYQDLKRIISAIAGKARRLTVIMPFLYEGRIHNRSKRESLDCSIALQELIRMGVTSIVTFDANDPRVQNSIPLHGFETYQSSYQFLKALFRYEPDFRVSPEDLMIISPDEGGMKRAIYMANVLGVDMGMFYKRRDYTKSFNGKHPVVAHEFLGSDVKGKQVIIVDDMISSGRTVLDVARELKYHQAGRIYICSTFGLFTNGLEPFDYAYGQGLFDMVLSTNLVYQPPELLERCWYRGVDMSKYLALMINTMNHDCSVSHLLDPIDRIRRLLNAHRT